ncbi:MAG: 2-oxo acid dehydrogenase subunit E2 [Burkholderiales bacterium]|nr:2-oxo acid dehydrogenase subunit E2 [Burkholderiales bacterium]
MIEFRLPSLGSDMDDGTLVEWRVQPGDTVKKGQVVAVVDTTKAAIDVECWDEGVVHALLAEPGTRLPVGAALAVLRAVGESEADVEREWAAMVARRLGATASRAGPAAPTAQAAAAAARGLVQPAAPTLAAPGAAGAGASLRVSPVARRLAEEHGLDLARIAAPRGIVSLEDVQAALRAGAGGSAPGSAASIVPHGGAGSAQANVPGPAPTAASRAQAMRQTIAAAMSRSKREIPHYYLAEEIEFARGAAWLAQRNADLPAALRLLPAALLLKSVALALRRYPEFNGFWREGAFVAAAGVHLGVAISLREGGLVAPALHDVDRHDIASLTRSLLDLVKRTRAGALRSSELADPTITVTNLGEQGVASVFGVIYPPQVALVGFGRIAPRPVVADDGSLRAMPMLTATLAADHRASDGHRGALLLAAVRESLQDPEALDRPGTAPGPQEEKR